jgi:hypothetical protein
MVYNSPDTMPPRVAESFSLTNSFRMKGSSMRIRLTLRTWVESMLELSSFTFEIASFTGLSVRSEKAPFASTSRSMQSNAR